MPTPNELTTGAAWLSASDAAARAGISKRAMQKRAASGKIGARKIGTGAAAQWEIDGRELDANLGANLGANREPIGREPGANLGAIERETGCELRTDRCEPGANLGANREPIGRELSGAREAELKEEITFLRGIVESDRRDMAELRAALREALKAMPKQLNAAPLDAATSPPGAASGDAPAFVVAQNARDLPKFKPPDPTTGEKSRAAPLTYNDIADQLERDLAARDFNPG